MMSFVAMMSFPIVRLLSWPGGGRGGVDARRHGLDVTFMSKPVEGVAGSGKHTHFGVAAKLNDGRIVNLFTALDPAKDYLSPLGYAALMGILKN